MIKHKNITQRKNPCLCVSCKCGSVFAASTFDKYLFLDEEWQKDLIKYASEGYLFSVKDSSEFEIKSCVCSNRIKRQKKQLDNGKSFFEKWDKVIKNIKLS